MKLIDQPRTQELLSHADAAYHQDRFVASRGRRLGDCRFDAVGYEGEGQAPVASIMAFI
jgi:hypothetical protein